MAEEQKIVQIPIDRITVPRERVTSVWDPSIEEEFQESIRAKGILEPITIMDIAGELYLVDGLHRIQAAERLGISQVPAIIKAGEIQDLLLENIIRNRQRGKSNPAQEAEVLAFLVEKRAFSLSMAAKQLGMSESWAQKLLKISRLPEQVKDRLKHGKIPVTGAAFIADLPRPEDQVGVARDAEFYNYTAEQIKARVYQLLNPDVEPEAGEIAFTEKGEVMRIPLTCHFCGKVLETSESYVWTCKECYTLARDTIEYYHKTYGSGKAGPEPASTGGFEPTTPRTGSPP